MNKRERGDDAMELNQQRSVHEYKIYMVNPWFF